MTILKMTNKQKESVERYRRIFPEPCKGKDDIEVLLIRRIITEKEALLMRTPKPKKARAKNIISKEPKVRPYTSKQIEKMCKAAMKDFIGDFTFGNDNITETEIESMKASAAYEMAESMIMFDERMQEYFRRSRVEKKYWKESLADYFV